MARLVFIEKVPSESKTIKKMQVINFIKWYDDLHIIVERLSLSYCVRLYDKITSRYTNYVCLSYSKTLMWKCHTKLLYSVDTFTWPVS